MGQKESSFQHGLQTFQHQLITTQRLYFNDPCFAVTDGDRGPSVRGSGRVMLVFEPLLYRGRC